MEGYVAVEVSTAVVCGRAPRFLLNEGLFFTDSYYIAARNYAIVGSELTYTSSLTGEPSYESQTLLEQPT